MAAVESAFAFAQPKIVVKAFTLPIISDTYFYGLSTASALTSPLHPYLSSSLASLPPLVETQLSHLLTLGEGRLPEMVTSRVRVARDQVSACVQYLDSTLCSGLDQLVVKVPSLASPSPALYSSTREVAVSQLTLATTYLASFTLAQLALKVSDASLESASSLLKQVVPASYTSQCEPLVDGIEKVRRQVEGVRREGARANGSKKVANMESSSSLSAICEVFGLNYILDIFGVSKSNVVAEVAAVTEASVTEASVTEASVTEAAVTEAAVTETAVTEAAVTEAAVTEAVVTEAAVTEASVTEASVTEAAVTEAAVTEAAVSKAAVTEIKMEVSGQSGAAAEVGKVRAFTVDRNGTVLNEIFDDKSVEDETIVDLPYLKEGKKSKKAYNN